MKLILYLLSLVLLAAPSNQLIENQPVVLEGAVTDDSGEVLIGATVIALQDGKTVAATVTNAEGKYRLSLEPGLYTLQISYTGYTAWQQPLVTVEAGKANKLDVMLTANAVLSEVVVQSAPTRAQKRAAKAERRAAAADRAAATSAPAKPAAPATKMKEAVNFDDDMRLSYETTPAAEDRDAAVLHTADYAPTQPAPAAGLLTAGEWNDLHHWGTFWVDQLADGEIDQYQTLYKFFPKNRYTVLIVNENDLPVVDRALELIDASGNVLWQARTDNNGKAELWAGLYDNKLPDGKFKIRLTGEKTTLGDAHAAGQGLNRYRVAAECGAPKNVDIVWAVDATGSMGDEIDYLKTELYDVVARVKNHNRDLAVRMGTVFYRDEGDEYVVRASPLTADIAGTVQFIRAQGAAGGGDFPEAVHSGLEEAIFRQPWSPDAVARICFLVLDASPHQRPDVLESLQKTIAEAARRGVRIVPVTCSGILKDTEYLMKFFGLATNGTYVFLTDHSGIGGKHLEPTTEEYKVEAFNNLLVRLITEYTSVQTCDGKSVVRFDDPQAQPNGQPDGTPPANTTGWQVTYYPNPASSVVNLELPDGLQSVVVYNTDGKVVRKLEKPAGGLNSLTVNDLSDGFYTLRFVKDGQVQSGKLLVVKGL